VDEGHEGIDDAGIELTPGVGLQFADGFLPGLGWAIRPGVGHGIKGIGDSDDSGFQGDGFAA